MFLFKKKKFWSRGEKAGTVEVRKKESYLPLKIFAH